MELFFLYPPTAFLWDRATALFRYGDVHDETIRCTMPSRGYPHDCRVFVFHRNGTTSNTIMYCFARLARIPYVVDIDDWVWDLPAFSIDPSKKNRRYLRFLDRLILHSAAVSVATPVLQRRLQEKYPGKQIHLIENATEMRVPPPSGAVIVNSDTFKMGERETSWFSEVIEYLLQNGIPVTSIGNNHNLQKALGPFRIFDAGAFSYHDYLAYLGGGRFRLGLVPVEHSDYADGKSDIKLLEFVGQKLSVIASDIAPYRTFAKRFPGADVRIVKNTKEEWMGAAKSFVRSVSQKERNETKGVLELYRVRNETQFRQWSDLLSLPVLKNSSPRCNHRTVLKVVWKLAVWFETRFG